MKQTCSLLLVLFVLISCAGEPTTLNAGVVAMMQNNATNNTSSFNESPFGFLNFQPTDTTLQIGRYIRCMYQDEAGNIWFGTYGDGICRYDPDASSMTGGKALVYYTKKGITGNVVRDIVEDATGKIWFATNGGVYCYDPDASISKGRESFTNYTVKDGLNSNEVWSILIDKNVSSGNVRIWFATENGVCRYDGRKSANEGLSKEVGKFTNFSVPEADLENFPNAYPSSKLVNCMLQDKTGNIWFGTNGVGVYCYSEQLSDQGRMNGESGKLINISEKDGLCNNFIQSIYEDRTGKLWFCSRYGGVSLYDPSVIQKVKSFKNFDKNNGLSSNFVWSVFEDESGEFWFATSGGGVCRYNPGASISKGEKVFVNFTEKDGLTNNYVQCILKDRSGNLWFGTGEGLFRYESDASLRTGEKYFISYQKQADGC